MKYTKKRYFLIEFFDDLDETILKDAIINVFKKMFGIINYSFANLKLIHFDKENRIAIYRCNKDYIDEFRACIFLLKHDSNPIQARVKLVSGTIKSIKRKLKVESIKSLNN